MDMALFPGCQPEAPIFFRQKTVKGYTYLQIVENRWEKGRSRQRVLATLGRLDQLHEEGRLEALFARDRDLFSSLQLVFFDTTSIYFEGEGGQSLGRRGHSKDHRPDLKQMVVGMVLDQEGRPISCELWPGNTSDVTTLVPVAKRLRTRFDIGRVCLIADRGMIQAKTLQALEAEGWDYIVGARMRSQKEVRDEVLGRGGRFRQVVEPRKRAKDPAGGLVQSVEEPSRVQRSRPGQMRRRSRTLVRNAG